jgi:hypothetical protein
MIEPVAMQFDPSAHDTAAKKMFPAFGTGTLAQVPETSWYSTA